MNKSRYGYIALVAVTGLLLVAIFIFSKKETKKVPPFRERTGSIALAGEWLNTKKVIEGLLAAIEANPDNNDAKLKLAAAYIEEARITGDHGYYDPATIELLDDVLKANPKTLKHSALKQQFYYHNITLLKDLLLQQKQ